MESREQNSGRWTWSGIDLKKTTTQSKNTFFLFLQNTIELLPSRTIEFCPSLYFAVATVCLHHGKTTVQYGQFKIVNIEQLFIQLE